MSDPVITGTADVRHLPVAEFRQTGFLQEVNRQFLHPLGLALSVELAPDGSERLGAIWDCRSDPEGVRFVPSAVDPDKARRVAEQRARLAGSRQARLGYVVQPAPGAAAVRESAEPTAYLVREPDGSTLVIRPQDVTAVYDQPPASDAGAS